MPSEQPKDDEPDTVVHFVRLILSRRVQEDCDGHSRLEHKTMCISDRVLRALLVKGWSLDGAVTE